MEVWPLSSLRRCFVASLFYLATTTYPSVSQTLKHLADLPPHPTLSIFNLKFPTKRAKIVQDFEEHIKQLTKIDDMTGKRKIIALIDSITSHPGVSLPWKEMVAICREAGVISVVDGAHSIGQELNINLSEARPDFWVSVCSPILLLDCRDAAFFPQRIATNGSFRRGEVPCFMFQRGLVNFSNFMGSGCSAEENQKPASHQVADPYTEYL